MRSSGRTWDQAAVIQPDIEAMIFEIIHQMVDKGYFAPRIAHKKIRFHGATPFDRGQAVPLTAQALAIREIEPSFLMGNVTRSLFSSLCRSSFFKLILYAGAGPTFPVNGIQ